jgi:hypothetical protein
MTTLPHDVADVLLAPVALHIDARIQELADMDAGEFAYEVAVRSDVADRTGAQRRVAVLAALTQNLELHGWSVAWDERGVRLSHGTSANSLVLGVPESLRDFVRD